MTKEEKIAQQALKKQRALDTKAAREASKRTKQPVTRQGNKPKRKGLFGGGAKANEDLLEMFEQTTAPVEDGSHIDDSIPESDSIEHIEEVPMTEMPPDDSGDILEVLGNSGKSQKHKVTKSKKEKVTKPVQPKKEKPVKPRVEKPVKEKASKAEKIKPANVRQKESKPKPVKIGKVSQRQALDGTILAIPTKKSGTIMAIFGVILMIVGIFNCITATNRTANAGETPADLSVITELVQRNNQLATELSELPEIESDMSASLMESTYVASAKGTYIRELAEQHGVVVQTLTSFEKLNSLGVLKANYQIEGIADAQKLVELLKAIKDEVVVTEVYLTEGTRLGGDEADNVAMVKEFRIVFTDVFSAQSGEKPLTEEESSVNGSPVIPDENSESSESENKDDEDVTVIGIEEQSVREMHQHTFDEYGWVTLATHSQNGTQARTCTVCGEVETLAVPAGEQHHTFPDGECDSLVCTVDGIRNPKNNHSFGMWTVVSPAECYVSGVASRKCIQPGCNKTEDKILPKIEHIWEQSNGKDLCIVCGLEKTEAITIEVM